MMSGMSDYKPTIGLEVHAELKTRTKMFCDSLNDPDEKHPNVNVCPVCLGHPGALPVPNRKAVEHVLRVGIATGGEPQARSRFDRKNYFYPDLPKAYQISQNGLPLVVGGALHGVKINHIHLEEDAGKLVHDDASGDTLVDYNRGGVPLMELVTEPDIHSAEDAVAFMRELQLVLRYLGASDADLERGQMRADANISVSAAADGALGTRAEVKNLNSFNAVFQAINYEITRQTELLEKGERVAQETRGWDDVRQRTTAQRSKEEAQDYRYFPEPDIPPIETAKAFDIDALRASVPELPAAKRTRFMKEYGLDEKRANALVNEVALANYFEEAVSELGEDIAKERDAAAFLRASGTVYAYLTSDLRGLMNQEGAGFPDLKVSPAAIAQLATLIQKDAITSRVAKDLLAQMFATGATPAEIMKQSDIGIVESDEVAAVVIAVIAEHGAAVADYKKGKTASLQFLIGQAMRRLQGRARPDMLKELFEKQLTS